MKLLYSLILVLLYSVVVFSTNMYAHGKEIVKEELRAQKALKTIPSSLESNIPGIVESSIYNAIVVKNYYPEGNYSDIIDRLNDISKENPDPAIRAKAHLASIYLNSNNIITVEPKHNAFDHEYIFRQITQQLDNKFLISSR
ncbi:MAG: hypothetical protein P8Z35_25155 [Ignavibacteriaceae bacterium]|jgi:hypothetical protein